MTKRRCLCGCRMPVSSAAKAGYYAGHHSKKQRKGISRARMIWLNAKLK